MRKLKKLKLHNLEEICVEEQRSLKGGGDEILQGPMIEEVVVYGKLPDNFPDRYYLYGGGDGGSVFNGANGFSSGGGFLANYLYGSDRGPDQIWDAFRGWAGSDVPSNANTTSAGGTTTMRITATFSRSAGTLSIYDCSGVCLGIYPAGNVTDSRSEGIWTNGTFAIMDQYSSYLHGSEGGDTYEGAYGSYGIFRAQEFEDADGDCRTYMGIHAGRSNNVNYPTYGCIRTTETAMADIQSFINGCGPLTSITVTD